MNTEITPMAVIKNAAYIPAAILFVGLNPVHFSILAIMLICDVITGAWRSAVINGGRSVTSWKAINGLMSKFLFLVIPLSIAATGQVVGLELIALAQTALGILTLATLYSIIGNVYGIRTGRVVEEFDAVRFILLKIEALLKKIEQK